ncbi:hypothetical protein OIU81_02875 [Streptomyces sp. NBC_01454]|uniref:hypothetical protein n=1 Tax=Streptomyces sp. NBC_01454 TaxID=2975867 RepID=UPI002E37F56C|nr:hypothetical protein [Streptomyces sp. NBC_01454]
MPDLPLQWNTTTAVGSEWGADFTLLDDDGTPMAINGKGFEFVIRPTVVDTASPPLIKVTATPTVQGYIAIDTGTATVQVVLTPTATALLGKGSRPFALWMDPGQPSATCLVEGRFNSRPTASV